MSRAAGIIIAIIVAALLVIGGIWLLDDATDEVDINGNDNVTDTQQQEETQQPEERNVFETMQANTELSTFTTAVMEADLQETLSGQNEYTVFAPNNSAFEDFIDERETTTQELLDRDDLDDILRNHIVATENLSADLEDGQELETLDGGTLTVNMDAAGTASLVSASGDTADIIESDLEANNGVIHIVDTVMLPQ